MTWDEWVRQKDSPSTITFSGGVILVSPVFYFPSHTDTAEQPLTSTSALHSSSPLYLCLHGYMETLFYYFLSHLSNPFFNEVLGVELAAFLCVL